MSIRNQKYLALRLLEWHGGQVSGLYAVGSCMLSDANRGVRYRPPNHRGHAGTEGAFERALQELRELRNRARFPEAVADAAVRECNQLADRLAKLGGAL